MYPESTLSIQENVKPLFGDTLKRKEENGFKKLTRGWGGGAPLLKIIYKPNKKSRHCEGDSEN